MRSLLLLSCLTAFTLAANYCRAVDAELPRPIPARWVELPAIPDREGFAGSYAGTSSGVLIVAGGANFPDKRPWEGGTKIWYDRVFALEWGGAQWREAGRLPHPSGYGVSIQTSEGILLIGGGDSQRNFSEVWLARWERDSVRFTAWPALPRPLAMAAGALVDRRIYVAGGLERPDAIEAQNVCYFLDLDRREAGWREAPPMPGGGRFLATAAANGKTFFLLSGARLVSGPDGKPQRVWLRDAWRYTEETSWKQIADLPRVAVGAPSPAPNLGGRILVLGGDDGAQTATPPTEHRGFPRDVLGYDPVSNSWTRTAELPFSLVTTPAAYWRGRIVIPGGEARPGVRSTAVWFAPTP
jgi:N-acetylneuraminic acid mutarotase